MQQNKPNADQEAKPPAGQPEKGNPLEKRAACKESTSDQWMLQQPDCLRRVDGGRGIKPAEIVLPLRLDQIERNGYDVFSRRARVPTLRKAATAARMMVTGPRKLNKRAELYQRRSMTDVTQDTY
jgi:hypothetical protein